MRMVSDRLCKEYQLSVVGQPEQGKGKHYAEWQAEQEGKPSYHSMICLLYTSIKRCSICNYFSERESGSGRRKTVQEK